MKRDIIWKIVESIKGDVNGKTPMIIANETSLSLSLVKSVLEKHSDIFTTVGSGSAYVLKKNSSLYCQPGNPTSRQSLDID